MKTASRRMIHCFVFALIVSMAIPAWSQKAAHVDSLLSYSLKHGLFNGAALVASGDSIISEKGYGSADMEWDIPVTATTKFRLGSVTKQFTALVVLQLVSDGSLSLDSTISSYLPYYRGDTGTRITIHHLLCHQSGIPNLTADPEYPEFSKLPFTTEEIITERCSGDPEFEPGSRYEYSNSNYVILGGIIESVSGTSYAQSVQERIFSPLDMHDSGYDHNDMIIAHRARGYQPGAGGYRNARYIDMSVPRGAGALYSTVRDLYLWDRALYGDDLLPATYRNLMFTPNKGDYGYGWAIRTRGIGSGEDSVRVIRHSGGINGFVSVIIRIPEGRNLIVLLSNTIDSKLSEISTAILHILYDEPYQLPKRPILPVLMETAMNGDIDAVVQQYNNLKTKHAEEFDFSERQLNILGYQLLELKRIDDAITIFELNIEAYPDSYNTYDSLGEAYFIAGRKEPAIANLKKSLQLNPENTHAEDLIQKIENEH